MNSIYVVRNAFYAHGKLYEVGTIIDDPTSIWVFRSRLNTRDIIQLGVDKKLDAMWFSYLSTRVRGDIDARIYKVCGEALPSTHPDYVAPAPKIATPKATAK